jgi:hypothetical protein
VYEQTEGYRPGVFAVGGKNGIRALLAYVIVSYTVPLFSRLLSRSLVIGGPIGDATTFASLLDEYDAEASRESGVSQIRNLTPPGDRRIFENVGYQWQDHLNYIIDLRPGERVLLAKMSKSRRKNIAGADRAGMVSLEFRPSDTSAVYGLLQETYSRAKVPLAPRSLFESATSLLVPRGQLWCYLASISGSGCAVRLVLRWKNTLYDWYAGSSDLGREHHADEWLVWQILKKGIQEGCTLFDFGGAGNPGEFYGPGEFKRQFGGQKVNLGRFDKIYRPIAPRVTATAYSLWRRWH